MRFFSLALPRFIFILAAAIVPHQSRFRSRCYDSKRPTLKTSLAPMSLVFRALRTPFQVSPLSILINFGFNRTRADHISPYFILSQLQRDHFGQCDLARFGRCISAGPRIAEHAGAVHRQGDDDRSALFFEIRHAYLIVKNVPLRLMLRVLSHASGDSSSSGAHTPLIPALANTISIRP